MTTEYVNPCCKDYPVEDKYQIELLERELDRLRADCYKFAKQADALSSLYYDALTREHDHLLVIEDLKRERNRYYVLKDSISQILFDEGKVRMSKETEKRLREILF